MQIRTAREAIAYLAWLADMYEASEADRDTIKLVYATQKLIEASKQEGLDRP